jgi:hypothetical protein
MWFSEQDQSKEHVYRRPLPSGGYVAIAADEVKPLFAPPKLRGRIIVERRGEDRRQGHAPPIVAIAERDNLDAIIAALKPMAESDEILGQALAQRVTIPITSRHNPKTG